MKKSKLYIIFILLINLIMLFIIVFIFNKKPDPQIRKIDIIVSQNNIPVYNADVSIQPYSNELFPHYAINVMLGKTNKSGLVQWNSGKNGKHKICLNTDDGIGCTYNINIKDNMDKFYININ